MHRHRFIVLGLATLFFVFEPISSANNTTNSTPTTTAIKPTPTTTSILNTTSPTSNETTNTSSSSTTTAPNIPSPPSIATTSLPATTSIILTTSFSVSSTSAPQTTSVPAPSLPTTSSTVTPTSPPRNKSITVEATFDITFKKEYLNKSSEAYEDLERNFKRVLNETFFELKGYLGVEILSFRNGSVVCEFNVIFKETANSEVGKVKETLQKASGSKKLGGYAVTNIKIVDVPTTVTPTPSVTVSVSVSSTSAPQTTSGPKPTTPSSNEFWDKVIMDYLGGTLISFIIMVVAVGLCLILLIALICTCHHYRKLKKKTQFPKDVIINNDSAWINSNDNLLMWERNLRATEVNPGNPPNRPTNEKRP